MRAVLALILTILAVVVYLPLFVFRPKGDPSITDWFIVIFTVVASGVALIQVLVSRRQAELAKRQTDLVERQAEIMNETLVETRKSADAATTAANAARAQERAWLTLTVANAFLEYVDPDDVESATLPARVISIMYDLNNYGRTPAVITDRRFGLIHIDPHTTDVLKTVAQTPTLASYGGIEGPPLTRETSPNRHHTDPVTIVLSDHDFESNTTHGLFWGVVEFVDIYGEPDVIPFAWELQWGTLECRGPDAFVRSTGSNAAHVTRGPMKLLRSLKGHAESA